MGYLGYFGGLQRTGGGRGGGGIEVCIPFNHVFTHTTCA